MTPTFVVVVLSTHLKCCFESSSTNLLGFLQPFNIVYSNCDSFVLSNNYSGTTSIEKYKQSKQEQLKQ